MAFGTFAHLDRESSNFSEFCQKKSKIFVIFAEMRDISIQ